MKHFLLYSLFWGLTTCPLVTSTAQNNAEGGLDNVFRTSDEDGETATQRNRRKGQRTQTLPEGSERVGCVCINGAIRNTTGVGSCSGQGGVRYWLVENAKGDTLQYPTARHALNADDEPLPYVGPHPQARNAGQPTIIIMPSPANGLADGSRQAPPQYLGRLDSQIIVWQAAPNFYDSTKNYGDPTALLGLPMVFNSIIQLCMVLVICGTLVIVLKLFLNQGTTEAQNSQKIFKNIRLTLLKILFKNNRFFK